MTPPRSGETPRGRRKDALIGAVVVAGLGALAATASRADRAIEAPKSVRAAMQGAQAPDAVGALPLFDAPCDAATEGAPSPATLTCRTPDGRAITLRLDAPFGVPAAALYAYPSDALLGGAIARARGVVLYVEEGVLRWTTSHRRARELARSTLLRGMLGGATEGPPPRLVFGFDGG